MKLSLRMLDNVAGINNFEFVNQVLMTEGDTPQIYFQLVDLAKDRAEQGFDPAGRRYVPAFGATLQVTLDHIDQARKVVRSASQPFSQDPSIWAVTLLPTDKLRGTVNLKVALTEGSQVTQGMLQAALNVDGLDGMTRL
jgi:hypothetical protein